MCSLSMHVFHCQKYVNDGPTEASHRWSTNVFHGAFRDLINDRICEKHEIYHCPGYTAEKENVSSWQL